MKLNKWNKIRVLENFYALDYILFGKSSKKMNGCCPILVDEFISLKGALMSIMIEFYKLVDHKPKSSVREVLFPELKKMAKKSATIARENSKRLVTSERGRLDIKRALREEIEITNEIDIEKIVQEKIQEKAFRLACDNLLIARTLTESKRYNNLNDIEGKIIEDSYKILRDALIESAIQIIESDKEYNESE